MVFFHVVAAQSPGCSWSSPELYSGPRSCSVKLPLLHRTEATHLPPRLIYRTHLCPQPEGKASTVRKNVIWMILWVTISDLHFNFSQPVFSVPAWKCSVCAPPGGEPPAVTPKHHWRHCHSTGEGCFFYSLCVSLIFFSPFHNSSSSQGFFFCYVWRKRLSNWRALPIISPLMYSFWKRFFLTSWKGQCCVCVLFAGVKWSTGGCVDRCFFFFFSLEEECETPLCTAALTAKNQELQGDMKKVTSIFEKLQNYINILALPSKFALIIDWNSDLNFLHYALLFWEKGALWGNNTVTFKCVSGVCQDLVPQSSTSAVFTQLAGCLHSLYDAIKGEQHCQPFLSQLLTVNQSKNTSFGAVVT